MAKKETLRKASVAIACCALWQTATAQAWEVDLSMLTSRDQLLAAFDHMPRPQLEQLFMRCDAESSRSVLGFGEGVLCAMAWDALLKSGFSGDVQALLAWWRAQRQAQTEASPVHQP